MPSNLNITLVNPSSATASRDLLRLEQEPWGSDIGKVSKKDTVGFILGTMFPEFSSVIPDIDCGMEIDGSIKCNILAYPAYPTLNYVLDASYGFLGPKEIKELEEKEAIVLSSSSSAKLKYPTKGVTRYYWEGDVFDYFGGLTPPPVVTFSSDEIELDKVVSGVLIVEYAVVRHDYVLTVFPREEAEENKFSSVVYGRYTGGINWVEVEPPPNADELSDGTLTCGFGSGGETSVGEDGDDWEPPVATHKDYITEIDYCTGDVKE